MKEQIFPQDFPTQDLDSEEKSDVSLEGVNYYGLQIGKARFTEIAFITALALFAALKGVHVLTLLLVLAFYLGYVVLRTR